MKLMLSILFFSICVLGTAQDTKTTIKSSFQTLSEEEKSEILAYAISLNGDMDKKMNKAIKKLSAKEQELLLRRMQGMEPAVEEPVVLNIQDASFGPAELVAPSTSLMFDEVEYDFEEIIEGDKVTHIFKFKNTGNEPLEITNARGSCGCTVPEWPKDPIAPGKKGEIKVVFNSKGKRGKQTKTITIAANTSPENTILRIKANVNEKTTNK